MCGSTAKNTARRMRKEFSGCSTKKSTRALWRRHPRRDMLIRAGIVYKRGDSDIHKVQKIWIERMPYRRK